MKRFIGLFVVASIVYMAIACSPAKAPASSASQPAAPAAKTRTLQIGHVNPGTDETHTHISSVRFAENLKRISNGAFQVDVFGDSQLGGERDMIEGLKMGTIEMTVPASFSLGSFEPAVMALDLPFLFKSREDAYKILDDEEIMKVITDNLYNKFDVKILGWTDGGFRNVSNSKRAVRNLNDIKGLKLRLPETPIYVDTFKALGSNPTTMAYSEIYTAIQQKTVDGIELPVSPTYSSRFYEIANYLSFTEHTFTSFPICLARSIWEGLSAEEKEWFTEAGKIATEEQRKEMQRIEAGLVEKMKAEGLNVNNDVNKEEFRAAVQSVYDSYRSRIGGDLIDKIEHKLNG